MKKNLLIVFILLLANSAKSQQIPMISQHYQIPFIYNPAYSGATTNPSAFVINHSQWGDIPGGPVTRAFTLDGSIQDKKAGLGIVVYNDITDITSRIGAYGSYSYRIKLNDVSYLGFGIALGVVDNKIDYSKIIVKDVNDITLFTQSQRKTSFDGNAGVLFDYKKLKIGISIPQLFGNKIKFFDNYTHSVYLMSRHYMGSIKYSFEVSKKQNITCSPLVLVRFIPGAPIQYDLNAMVDWKKIVGIGVTYKSNYAVSANTFVKIHNAFTVGYSYDFITSKINSYAGTSHELLLGYTFGIKRKKELEELQTQVNTMQIEIEEDTKLSHRNKERIDSMQLIIDKLNSDKLKPAGMVPPAGNGGVGGNVTVGANAAADNKAFDESQNTKEGASKKAEKISPFKIGTVDEDGARIISKKGFLDSNGKEIKVGYYIVVGTFFYKEYAMAEIQRFKERGYPKTTYVYYEPLHYHYIHVDYVFTKEEALAILKKVRTIESDVCLLLNIIE